MNERAMLELAALAAGLEGAWGREGYIERAEGFIPTGWRRRWGPREDDGDAFRLMVATRQSVHQFDDHACAEAGFDWDCREVYTTDPAAATRLAIVRAAAEIGRKIKEGVE